VKIREWIDHRRKVKMETENGNKTDRDGHETSLAETETRPRRDVCRSRDVTETLKCTLSLMQY